MCSKVWEAQLSGAHLEPSPASGEPPWESRAPVGEELEETSPSGGLLGATLPGSSHSVVTPAPSAEAVLGGDARTAPLQAGPLCQQPGAGALRPAGPAPAWEHFLTLGPLVWKAEEGPQDSDVGPWSTKVSSARSTPRAGSRGQHLPPGPHSLVSVGSFPQLVGSDPPGEVEKAHGVLEVEVRDCCVLDERAEPGSAGPGPRPSDP